MLLTSRDGSTTTSATKLYRRGDSLHAFFPEMLGLDQGNVFYDKQHIGTIRDNILSSLDLDGNFKEVMVLLRLPNHIRDRVEDILNVFPYLDASISGKFNTNTTDRGVYIGKEYSGEIILDQDYDSDFIKIQLAQPFKKLKKLTGTKQLTGLPIESHDGRFSGSAMGLSSRDNNVMWMYNYPIESLQRMEAELGLTELSSVQ